jgi:hypothetical protein
MMVRADRAMYEAKQQGGNRAAVYAAHREFDIVEPGGDSIVTIRAFVSGEGELAHHRCPGEGSFLRLRVPVLDR